MATKPQAAANGANAEGLANQDKALHDAGMTLPEDAREGGEPAGDGAEAGASDEQSEPTKEAELAEHPRISLLDALAEAQAQIAKLTLDIERADAEIERLGHCLDAGAEETRKALAARQITAEQSDAILKAAGVTSAAPLGVWEVNIPGCLLGVRYVLAPQDSEAEAVAAYKRPAGITAHREPAVAHLTDFDPNALPKGITLWQ